MQKGGSDGPEKGWLPGYALQFEGRAAEGQGQAGGRGCAAALGRAGRRGRGRAATQSRTGRGRRAAAEWSPGSIDATF